MEERKEKEGVQREKYVGEQQAKKLYLKSEKVDRKER